MQLTPFISIIIPVKPPELHLQTLLQQLHSVFNKIPHEILVQTESGLGNAVREGIKKSKGDILIVMDSDGSHVPHYLPKMLDLLTTKNADIVIGSRFIQGGANKDSFFRRCITFLYNKLTRFLLQIDIKDPMSGYIVCKRRVLLQHPIPDSFKILLPTYADNNLKIIEYPITFLPRKIGTSKTSLKTGVNTLLLLLTLSIKKNFTSISNFCNFLLNSVTIYFLLHIFSFLTPFLSRGTIIQTLLQTLLANPLATWIFSIEVGGFLTFYNITKQHKKVKQQYAAYFPEYYTPPF